MTKLPRPAALGLKLMNGPFNVNQYWLKRGRAYIDEALPKEFHRVQERFLFDVLRAARLPMRRILEIGCGFGRITQLLGEHYPRARITALDLSPEQLENARRYCGRRDNLTFAQYDFYSGLPFPGSGYDATVAIEVFLHHPRPVIQGLFAKLAAISRYLVNIDWSEPWPWKTAEHVWVHDYAAVYRDAGLQCAAFALPQKIDGMQQKLFIAGKTLPPELLQLEQQARAEQPEAAAASPNPGALPPEAAQWPQQVQLSVEEILAEVPAGGALVLVNDDQWGNERQTLTYRRIFPFLERKGQYWGPPPDDATAIRELERLRQVGAEYLAIAWNSFWWLEHYAGFRRHLEKFPCLRRNERLIVFDLK